mmetsp:Transcript_3242/g.9904  ORF Transcript_3242/g.9904 Transcript_3242/m.9904 type:complete len:273 (+) Transcript_3242:145-963(+)
MSLAHSHKDLSTKDASLTLRFRATEPRPRALSRPDSQPDERSAGDRTAVYTKPSGNAKPQEPALMAPRRKGFPPRTAGHMHAKSWSSSSMPGKKENPAGSNQYKRTWVQDSGLTDKVGKWTGPTLTQFYAEQDKALMKLKPNDEVFAKNWNMKYWTHLEGEGAVYGGQQKVQTNPARSTGVYLKGGLYVGKFENIKHAQLIIRTGFRTNGGEGRLQEWHKDTKRPAFDNRLNDDMIRRNDAQSVEIAQANLDIFRPTGTMSCPLLGADFVNR